MKAFQMPFLPPEALADEASLVATSERAVTLARRGETRAAINLALQARRRAQSIDAVRGELAALNAAAMVHLIRGDAVAAVAAALDARDLARRCGDRSFLAHALVTLQSAALVLGAADESNGALHECTEEAIDAGDPWLETRARMALGIALGDQGHFDAAAGEFHRALLLALDQKGVNSPARIQANIANLHRKRAAALIAAGFEARGLRECGEAELAVREACRLAGREGAVSVEIDALAIAGCIRELRGDNARARVLLRESIALGRASRCTSAVVWVLCELGRLALAADDLDESQSSYAAALETARELRPTRKIPVACAGLAEVHARRGDPACAGAWRERAAAEEAAFQVASLQTRRQLR